MQETMMQFVETPTAVALLNEWGCQGQPFFFFVDYAGQQWYVARLDELDARIKYSIPGRTNYTPTPHLRPEARAHRLHAPRLEDYAEGFGVVQRAIAEGKTRLINLTWRIPYESDYDQQARFMLGHEKYMLMVEGLFSVFSPEPFVEVRDGRIATFPMKGTISTSVPNAREVLLASDKEAREHADSVELMRHDLERVASDVEVVRFRYCEEIADGRVIQTSSEIAGQIRPELLGRYGDIIASLLPGGSIAGAPKEASLEVIAEAEPYDRGFYTGVFGVFDGERLDTSVMIRFLQYLPSGESYFYGGGGVTAHSQLESEYQELLLKANATILY